MVNNINRILIILIISLTCLTIALSQTVDSNIRIIQFNRIGQQETIKKGENYRIIYGVANPENTRIRYKQSSNYDEYILELVYYEDLVRASDDEEARPEISQQDYDKIKSINDSLQNLLENLSKSESVENNEEDNPPVNENDTQIEEENKISQEQFPTNTDEGDIESLQKEKENTEESIKDLREKIKFLQNSDGSPEEISKLQKELDGLRIKNYDLSKDIELKQLALEKSQQFNIFLIIIIVLVLILAIAFYFNYKSKKNANKQLKNLNEELAEKNVKISHAHKQITDSIDYALRIQKAVLPNKEKLNELLDDHFLLFKPKSTVSGDFYWIEKVNGVTFVAVVDCTGHGVPGAFMSIIGNDLLNQIIKGRKLYQPSKILEELHIGVRVALKQKDVIGETSDGMELCLLKISDNKITFAGAKRPFWYVKNDKFHEIKGTRKPIGGRQKEKVRRFDEYEIIIDDEMMIYLTSDGFSDQNNPENKSYTTRKLKRFLKEISNNTLEIQYDLLSQELERHSDGEPNRDDITDIRF